MKTYGIVVIGCGYIGRTHLRELAGREDIRLIATVDADLQRAEQAAREFGAAEFGADYQPFLARQDVDIALIATYTASHLPILKDCLAAGKHVLCEKPVATSREAGAQFFKAVRQSECRVLVAHILRYNESYRFLASAIHGGEIGQLQLARLTQLHKAEDWARYKRLLADCPPYVDCGVHYYDVLQWFAGARIERVGGTACKLDQDAPTENYGNVVLHLQNGCTGIYEVGWSPKLAQTHVREFVGTKGRLTLTPACCRGEDWQKGDLITLWREGRGETQYNIKAKYKDMYRQMKDLISMIETGSPGEVPLEAAESAFVVALAAKEALERRQEVDVF